MALPLLDTYGFCSPLSLLKKSDEAVIWRDGDCDDGSDGVVEDGVDSSDEAADVLEVEGHGDVDVIGVASVRRRCEFYFPF